MGRWITKNGRRIYLDDGLELYDALVEHYSNKKNPTIYLDREEYAIVMSNFDTWINYDKVKNKVILSKCIGNYIYTVEKKGYNDIRIIGRDMISSIDELEWEDEMNATKKK